MDDLRQSLHVLVQRPPAAPLAVEVVAARGIRYRRRRQLAASAIGLALVAVVSAAALVTAQQDPEQGVVLDTEGSASAGYIAEQPGGYVATGTWRLLVTRGGQVIELSSTSSDRCGPTGIIRPGDEVRGSIAGPDSSLRVGERFACPENPP